MMAFRSGSAWLGFQKGALPPSGVRTFRAKGTDMHTNTHQEKV